MTDGQSDGFASPSWCSFSRTKWSQLQRYDSSKFVCWMLDAAWMHSLTIRHKVSYCQSRFFVEMSIRFEVFASVFFNFINTHTTTKKYSFQILGAKGRERYWPSREDDNSVNRKRANNKKKTHCRRRSLLLFSFSFFAWKRRRRKNKINSALVDADGCDASSI